MSGICPTSPPSREQCRGDTASGQEWFNFWNCDACYNTYFDFIYASPDGQQWNKDNWQEAQNDFVTIFNRYLDPNRGGYKITVPGAEGFNSFRLVLNRVCLRLPGVCDKSLQAYCQGKNITPSCPNCNCGKDCATREGIAQNAGLVDFCGCYAPRPPNDQGGDFINKYPQCDPLCTRIDTIKLDNGTGNNNNCMENTCVIDDVSIEAASSTVGGTVNFNQICNQCGSGPCVCIISGIDLSETGDKVPQLQSQFNQFCGDNSQCLKIESNGIDTPVKCQQALTQDDNQSPNNGDKMIGWIWLIVVIIFVIIIAGLIIWSIQSDKSKRNRELKVATQRNE